MEKRLDKFDCGEVTNILGHSYSLISQDVLYFLTVVECGTRGTVI